MTSPDMHPSKKQAPKKHLDHLLTAYLFENISPAGKAEVEAHLQVCPQCRTELEHLRSTLGMLKGALVPGDGEAASLERPRLEEILRAKPRKKPWKWLALAAAAVVVMGFVIPLFFTARNRVFQVKSSYTSFASRGTIPASSAAAPLQNWEITGGSDGRGFTALESKELFDGSSKGAKPEAPAIKAKLLADVIESREALGDLNSRANRGAQLAGEQMPKPDAEPQTVATAPVSPPEAARYKLRNVSPPEPAAVPPAKPAALGTVAAVGTTPAPPQPAGGANRPEGIELAQQTPADAPAQAGGRGSIALLRNPVRRELGRESTKADDSNATVDDSLAMEAKDKLAAEVKAPPAAAGLEPSPKSQTRQFKTPMGNDSSALGLELRKNQGAADANSFEEQEQLAQREKPAENKKLSKELDRVTKLSAIAGKSGVVAGGLDGVEVAAKEAAPSSELSLIPKEAEKRGEVEVAGALGDESRRSQHSAQPDFEFFFGANSLIDKKQLADKKQDGEPPPAAYYRFDANGLNQIQHWSFVRGLNENQTGGVDFGFVKQGSPVKGFESLRAENRWGDWDAGLNAWYVNGLDAQGVNHQIPLADLALLERRLRAFRYWKLLDPNLTPEAFAARDLPIPQPAVGDEGLGEEGFRKRYGVNPFVDTGRDHLSTFGMDVDTASYTIARNSLKAGKLPPPKSIRVEEFVNYFREDCPADPERAFSVFCEGGPSPFRGGLEVLKIAVKARELRPNERKPAVLTFSVDTSGSMAAPAEAKQPGAGPAGSRLDLVKATLRTLVASLDSEDRVGIVAYSTSPYLVLPHTAAREKDRILSAIDSLAASGATNVESGLDLSYRVADEVFQDKAVNRVILCSDGVANAGARGPEEIIRKVEVYAKRGIYLTCLGFGMGRYNDSLLETLGDKGNGNYAYIDSIAEAEKLFKEKLLSTLQVLAQDAKIQVDFNPQAVSHYRLLGYEKRDIADKDFRNDQVDAGEVGPGTTVTVLYEIRRKVNPLGELGRIALRYRDAGTARIEEASYPLNPGVLATTEKESTDRFRFTASVAEAAELLRESYWSRGGSFGKVLLVLQSMSNEFRDRPEWKDFADLVIRAQTIQITSLAKK